MMTQTNPSLTSLFSRFQRWTLVAAILFLFASMFLARSVLPPDPRYFREFGENDFLEYWTAFHLAERGMDPFNPQFVQGVEREIGWNEPRPLMMWNPPWTLTILSPILNLSFDEAARAFLGLNIGLAVLAVLIAAIALGFDGLPLLLVSAVSLCNFPLYLLLMKGQTSLIPTLGISLLFLALLRNRPALAGLAMIPLSVKPHLAYLCLLPLCFEVISRRWKTFVLVAGAGMLVLLLSTWVLFPESLGFWWNRSQHDASPLLVKVTSWKTTTLSFALRNVLYYYTKKLPLWPMWFVPLATSALLTLLCVFRPAYLRGEKGSSHFSWKYFLPLLLPLSVTSAPFGWIFDCVSLMISGLAVFALLKESQVGVRLKVLLLLGLLLLQGGTIAYGLGYDPTLEDYWAYPLLFAALAYAVWVASEKGTQALLEAPSLPRVNVRALLNAPLLLVFGVAGLLRFLFILRPPPFFDETGNIIVSIFPSSRLMLSPLRQARPFLAYQFSLAGLLPLDPILVGRVMTGATAFVSMALLFLILRRFSGVFAGLLAAIFWAISPFHIFHERMVLQDPTLTMFLLCSLGCILLAKDFPSFLIKPLALSWKRWAVAGIFFGLAVSVKVTAVEIAPFLALLVYLFATRQGQGALFSRNLLNGLAFFSILAVLTLFGIAGTFREYGIDHLTMGHLGGKPQPGMDFLSKVEDHLGTQFSMLSSYLGKPFSYLYLGLLLGGLLFRVTRPLVFMIFLLLLAHTQLYQGRWYTRYFHPDFILHALFLGLLGGELLKLPSLQKRFSKDRAEPALALGCLVLGLFVFSPELTPMLLRPMETAEPKKDSYLKGYYSGKGVVELKDKIDEILAKENRVVIFVCQYWATGMYEALLHSLTISENKLYVLPFELFHPNRALGVVKLMKKFQEELPGKTTFLFLFESPRYPLPPFLHDMGLPINEVFNLLRETTDERVEHRFWLEQIGEVDETEVLRALNPQLAPYSDDWLGPKAEIRLGSPPAEDLLLSFPKDLPPSTQVEVTIGTKTLVSSYVSDIQGPLPVARADFENPNPSLPLVFSLRCSDWIIPQLSSGRRDNRALCAKLSGKLNVFEAEKAAETTASAEKNEADSAPPRE